MDRPRSLLYLVGVPGSGKTTLFRRLLAGVPAETHTSPFGWTSYPGGVQLGVERGAFSGTDVLPMNVQPRVLAWLDRCPYRYVVAEGDRLANGVFFDAVRAQGWHLTVATLDIEPGLASTRRESLRRTYQSPVWVRGRMTKVANLTRMYADPAWRLDARQPLDLLARRLRTHPAFVGLVGGPPQA